MLKSGPAKAAMVVAMLIIIAGILWLFVFRVDRPPARSIVVGVPGGVAHAGAVHPAEA